MISEILVTCRMIAMHKLKEKKKIIGKPKLAQTAALRDLSDTIGDCVVRTMTLESDKLCWIKWVQGVQVLAKEAIGYIPPRDAV